MSNHVYMAVQGIRTINFGDTAIMRKKFYSEKFMWSKLDYIHLNPIRAGIVERASDYIYSSATNYVGEESILKAVVLVANPIIDVLKASSFTNHLNQLKKIENQSNFGIDIGRCLLWLSCFYK